MFNICNMNSEQNTIYLYDERVSGKAGNAVCSLRFQYHTNNMKYWLERGCTLSSCLKIMDNCCAQNKSSTTFMFDALLSIVLYDRVADFYLLPGHSHMRPDQVTSLTKNALKRKDLFIPDQIADAMSPVKNMEAKVITSDMAVFNDWESYLKKHFLPMPPGFTKYYCFELVDGKVVYKRLCGDPDGTGKEHTLCANPKLTRKVILKELFGLPPDASLWDIVNAKVNLPVVEPRVIADSKIKSIRKKMSCIPVEYRYYYPELPHATRDADDEEDAVLEEAVEEPTSSSTSLPGKSAKRRGVGRPKNPVKVVKETSSILKFLISPTTLTERTAADSTSSKLTEPAVVKVKKTVTSTVTSHSSLSAKDNDPFSSKYMQVDDLDAYELFDELSNNMNPADVVDPREPDSE